MTIAATKTPQQEDLNKIAAELKKRIRVACDEDGHYSSDDGAKRFDKAIESGFTRSFSEVEKEIADNIKSEPTYEEKERWRVAERACRDIIKIVSDETNKIYKDPRWQAVPVEKIPIKIFDECAKEIMKNHKGKCAIIFPHLKSPFVNQYGR